MVKPSPKVATDWMFLSPSNSYVEALIPNEMGALGSNEVPWVEPSWWDQCPYSKNPENPILCRMRRQQEGTIYKPRREPSPEPNHAGTLVSDLQPPELRNLCCLSHPAYGLLFSLTKQLYSSLNWLRQNQRFQRSFKLLYPNEVLEHLVPSIQLNTQGLPTMKSKSGKLISSHMPTVKLAARSVML